MGPKQQASNLGRFGHTGLTQVREQERQRVPRKTSLGSEIKAGDGLMEEFPCGDHTLPQMEQCESASMERAWFRQGTGPSSHMTFMPFTFYSYIL